MEHNNDKMSLAVYLVVEKPNKNLKRTLGMIYLESPIVRIDKLRNGNIDVWSRQQDDDSSSDNQHFERFNISEVNTTSGDIVSVRQTSQALPNEFFGFKK